MDLESDYLYFSLLGPYRFSRHPIYSSMLSFKIGTAIYTLDLVLIVLLALMFVLVSLRLKDYERVLIAKYGDTYVLFLQSRGPLIPCSIGIECMGLGASEFAIGSLQPMLQGRTTMSITMVMGFRREEMRLLSLREFDTVVMLVVESLFSDSNEYMYVYLFYVVFACLVHIYS
jgi:hypothetical protein